MASSSRLKPGEKGKIHVVVDPAGKRGIISKTIKVFSNDPKQPVVTLSVTMEIKDAVHMNKFSAAKIFEEACRSCHVEQGRGKTGFDLFRADCFMCHNAGKNAPTITAMSKRPANYIRKKIRDGVEETSMPGWASDNGGPLTDDEIESLVRTISKPN